jgi:hypothetical protein
VPPVELESVPVKLIFDGIVLFLLLSVTGVPAVRTPERVEVFDPEPALNERSKTPEYVD